MDKENIKKMYKAFTRAKKEIKNKDKPQSDYFINNKVLIETVRD